MAENIADLLHELMSSRNISQRKVAAYCGASPQAMNQWTSGKLTPGPRFVWKIASLAHMPVEDVMRLAGHLPPLADVQEEPDLPSWSRLINHLSKTDRRVVQRIVESMAADPIEPDEPTSPGASA